MKINLHHYKIEPADTHLTCQELIKKLSDTEQFTLNAYGIIRYYKQVYDGEMYLVVETYDSCD